MELLLGRYTEQERKVSALSSFTANILPVSSVCAAGVGAALGQSKGVKMPSHSPYLSQYPGGHH